MTIQIEFLHLRKWKSLSFGPFEMDVTWSYELSYHSHTPKKGLSGTEWRASAMQFQWGVTFDNINNILVT